MTERGMPLFSRAAAAMEARPKCGALLVTDDPDAMRQRATEAGATETSPPREEHGWRLGRIVDPFGHEWEIGKPIRPWPPDLTTVD